MSTDRRRRLRASRIDARGCDPPRAATAGRVAVAAAALAAGLAAALPGTASRRPDAAPADGARASAPAADTGVTVIRDVALLTMERAEPLPRHAVIVRDGRIAWMGPASALRAPPGARVVEGGGGVLLPGLADMHAHAGREDFPLFLANGVTTVREMNGSPAHLAWRDSIEAGRLPGPRLLVTSPLLAGTAQRWRHELLSSPDDARRRARELAAAGYAALKVYDGLDSATYAVLAGAARGLAVPLVGHIPRAVGLDGVLRAGQRGIEHVEQIAYATVGHAPDTARIPEIAARLAATSTWVTPSLAAQRILTSVGTRDFLERFDAPEMRHVDPGTMAWWRSLAPAGSAPLPPDDPRARRRSAFYAFQRALVGALHRAGVPLLAGTDTPNPLLVPGFSLRLELEALVDAGLTRHEALRAATADAARFAGREGEWGTIRPGAAADLVLVARSPLDDLDALRAPVGVMVRGRWLDRAALDLLLAR